MHRFNDSGHSRDLDVPVSRGLGNRGLPGSGFRDKGLSNLGSRDASALSRSPPWSDGCLGGCLHAVPGQVIINVL